MQDTKPTVGQAYFVDGFSRVGTPYKTERAAKAYAERVFTGAHVADRDEWEVSIRRESAGWQVFIKSVSDDV